MKKLFKFISKKIKKAEIGAFLFCSIFAMISFAIILALTSLPGVAIAYFIGGANQSMLVTGGMISFVVVCALFFGTEKLISLVREYKEFSSEE